MESKFDWGYSRKFARFPKDEIILKNLVGEEFFSIRIVRNYALVETKDVNEAIEDLESLKKECFDLELESRVSLHPYIVSLERLIALSKEGRYDSGRVDFSRLHIVIEYDNKPYAVFIDEETKGRVVDTLGKQLFEMYKKAEVAKSKDILSKFRHSADIFVEFAEDVKKEYGELAREARCRAHVLIASSDTEDPKRAIEDLDKRLTRAGF